MFFSEKVKTHCDEWEMMYGIVVLRHEKNQLNLRAVGHYVCTALSK